RLNPSEADLIDTITINRVPADPVLAFWKEMEKYAGVDEANQNREALQHELISSFYEFRTAAQPSGSDIGQEFRTYLSVVGRDPQGVDSLYDQLSRLGRAMDDLQRMYLSESESRKAASNVLEYFWVGAEKWINEELIPAKELDVFRADEVMSFEDFKAVVKAFQARPERLVASGTDPLDPDTQVDDDGNSPDSEGTE
ncbi:MAG: hypothetical protein KDA21_10350, partial [Phycisphaerales bacterium]|nr:hypothetical protein [Phycisphaerales bacterium]